MKWVYKRSFRACKFAALLAGITIVAERPAAVASNVAVDGRPAARHAADLPYAVTEPRPGEFRFEVRAGDRWSVDRLIGASHERAELSLDRSPIRFGVRYRVSYEMLIEPGPPLSSDWVVAGQWHATEDEGDAPSSPPLAFELIGRDLVIYTQATTLPVHTKNPKGIERARISGIARGRWIRIAYDMRFDPARGHLRVRVDGRRIFSGAIPLGYADKVGPYFKFGIYRAKAPETIAISYRNLAIQELR